MSTVTIVSFVAFFSPQRRKQAGWTGPRDQVGSINGRGINRDEYAGAYREAELRYLFSYGDWPGNDTARQAGNVIERETRQRLLLLEKLNELNIQVTEPAVAQWIMDAFRDRTDKSFREETYRNFLKNVLPSRGLSQSDFERFARHEVAIQHLVALAGTAGKLVTPQEAETLFRQQNEEMEATAVFVSSSNYIAQVTTDPSSVAAYFTNHLASYRIPEKTLVSFVKFATSNYLAEADQELAKNTNLNQYVEATYLQRGTNAFHDASNQPLPPAEAKQKIREEIREAAAMEEARRKAVAFANELFEMKEKTNALESLAAAKGLVSEVSEPFGPYQTPSNMKVPPAFSQVATKLSNDEPFAEQPLQGDDGIYIVALKGRIPSQIPPLESMQDRVTQDYQNSRALELARAAGRELQTALTNGLAQGKTFESIAAEKGVSPVLLAPFSRKTTTLPGIPNSSDSSLLVSTAFNVSPGKVSPFIPTRTGGFVIHVRSVLPVADTKLQAELPEFLKSLRQSRQYQAFSDWFRKEMDTARISLPGDKKSASAR